MTPTKELTDVLKNAPTVSSFSGLLMMFVNSLGEPQKTTMATLENTLNAKIIQHPILTDLDNPPYSGFFFVNGSTLGVKPAEGYWVYGLIINMTDRDSQGRISGIQFWITYQLQIAIRAKESGGTPWKTWRVI